MSTPEIYFVKGSTDPAQLKVLGSHPGESDYSPIWRETDVQFKRDRAPVLLTSDTRIEQHVKEGRAQRARTAIRRNCPVVSVGG